MAAAPAFVTGLAGVWSWHVAAFGAATVGAAVFALLQLRRAILDDQAAQTIVAAAPAPTAPARAESQLAFLASPAVWLCFLFFFLIRSGFGVLQTYAPTMRGADVCDAAGAGDGRTDRVPARQRGGHYGFVYSGTDIGLALAPILLGPALDAGHFAVALYAIAVFQAAALAGALRAVTVGRAAAR